MLSLFYVSVGYFYVFFGKKKNVYLVLPVFKKIVWVFVVVEVV